MSTSTKTIRLPSEVVTAVVQRAEELGLTFTHIVEVALRDHLSLDDDPAYKLVLNIRDHLRHSYDDDFPQDVTLRVFQRIKSNQEWAALYERALSGNDREKVLVALHRRIGKAVRLILGAEVIGRSLPLDPAKYLIKSHALLVPTSA
jgi:hypothetical protein